jgi:DNA-directed RNA polymerase subunit RPC12/RpoP
MKWRKLLDWKCPQCSGGQIRKSKYAALYECPDCGFRIGIAKFDALVKKMQDAMPPREVKSKHFDEYQDNLSALNNLGREVEPEGYRQPDN